MNNAPRFFQLQRRTKALSHTASHIFTTKFGYRNDSLSSRPLNEFGPYRIDEILDYEINELGNTDIINTCNRLYQKDPLAAIRDNFRTDNVYAMWFTSIEGVLKHYADPFVTKISHYTIPHDMMILSDLNTEGVLIATAYFPRFIRSDYYKSEQKGAWSI